MFGGVLDTSLVLVLLVYLTVKTAYTAKFAVLEERRPTWF